MESRDSSRQAACCEASPCGGKRNKMPSNDVTHWRRSRLFPAFFALVSLVSSAAACPRECDCTTSINGTVVDCRYQRLQVVPHGFPQDTIEINLGHNSITTLTKSSFPPLLRLRKLLLDWCQIASIDADAFFHLGALEVLQLSNNAITRIDAHAFRNLSALRKLHLDYNQILSLPPALFEYLHLEQLMLHGNEIQTLDDRLFWGSSVVNLNLDENNFANISARALEPLKGSLKSFNLSHNKRPLVMGHELFSGFDFVEFSLSYCGLRDPSFLGHVKAQSLDVSGQPFRRINLTAYENLRPTEEMYLRNLSIDRLSESILGNLISVRVLDLSKNRLIMLDGDVFRYTPNLRVLILDQNLFLSLPENFGVHLGRLEALHVSSNRLAVLRSDAFQGMGNLQALDVRYNKLQVVDSAMRPVLDGLRYLKMGGNPLHCNCEMRWFREWLETYPQDTGADDCQSPRRGYIWLWEPEDFRCRPPTVQQITSNMNAKEWDNVFLTCKAEGDPAPEVQWTSPFGDVISVTPPFNRTQYATYGIWHLAQVRPHQGGWYTCSATSIAGSTSKSMYMYVVSNGSSTIDVDSLTMPTTSPTTTTTPPPPSVTTTHTTTTSTTTTAPSTTARATTQSSTASTTKVMTSSTDSTTSSTSLGNATEPKATPTKTTTPKATTSENTVVVVSTTESDDISGKDNERHGNEGGLPAIAVVIIIASVGGAFLIILAAVLLTRYIRRKKYIREYEVSPRSEPLANNNYNAK